MSAMTTIAVQGRWGWYACDLATFHKIKAFHKLLFHDFCASKRHDRWSAKQPHNRVHRNSATGETRPIAEPNRVGTDREYYLWVLGTYRAIRKPAESSQSVPLIDLPQNWSKHHAKLQEFYGASE